MELTGNCQSALRGNRFRIPGMLVLIWEWPVVVVFVPVSLQSSASRLKTIRCGMKFLKPQGSHWNRGALLAKLLAGALECSGLGQFFLSLLGMTRFSPMPTR